MHVDQVFGCFVPISGLFHLWCVQVQPFLRKTPRLCFTIFPTPGGAGKAPLAWVSPAFPNRPWGARKNGGFGGQCKPNHRNVLSPNSLSSNMLCAILGGPELAATAAEAACRVSRCACSPCPPLNSIVAPLALLLQVCSDMQKLEAKTSSSLKGKLLRPPAPKKPPGPARNSHKSKLPPAPKAPGA